MNNDEVTLKDITEGIDAYKIAAGIRLIEQRNNNENYCCYFCDEVISNMDFRCVAIEQYEWENDIEYLTCGVRCPRVPEHLKKRCCVCNEALVEIGYYKDLQDEMRCCDCCDKHDV